jgi:hypothetical protein
MNKMQSYTSIADLFSMPIKQQFSNREKCVICLNYGNILRASGISTTDLTLKDSCSSLVGL